MADDDDTNYDEKIKFVSAIARPLASKKSTKRLHKLVTKASKVKCVRRGVKEVVKALRKGEKGFCVIAGDISPVDVISLAHHVRRSQHSLFLRPEQARPRGSSVYKKTYIVRAD